VEVFLALVLATAACGSGQDHAGGDSGDSGDSSSTADAESDAAAVMSGDGFGASRMACVNKINELRATNTAVKLAAYTLVDNTTLDACLDTQASNDQKKNSPHYSFLTMSPSCPWGFPSTAAQDECGAGFGTSPAGIENCLQAMWNESLKPNCLGCVGCTTPGGACPNCDPSGMLGYECGHYVNMSAPYFTTVACGFAGAAPSSMTGWSVQNFE
jgi:hypothetical protein